MSGDPTAITVRRDGLAPGRHVSPLMVGRRDLVELAERRLAESRAGHGEVLLLAGEAGVGKTRLLAAIIELAIDQGFAPFRATAFPRDGEVTGAVVADLAKDIAASGDPLVASRGKAAVTRLRAAHLDAEGVPAAGDSYRRRRVLAADLEDLIASVATDTGPALIALEDLHWADELTLEVLDRVAHRDLSDLLVVATYRSDELYPRVALRQWRSRLLNQRLVEEVRLDRLSLDETTVMLTAIRGELLPSDVVALIHRRSDGVPLHAEELLAGMSSGQIAQHGSTGEAVPETLAAAMLSRAQLLSEDARRLVDAAAVIGRSFDLDLLAAIVPDQPTEIDSALRELEDRSFVASAGDDLTYDFRHALIRDALVTDVEPLRRRALHASVADAAAARGLPDAFVSDHYERAHRAGPAYRYARSAARDAISLSAHREAVSLLRRAQRTMPTDLPLSERVELLISLGEELAAVDDNVAALDVLTQALDLRRSAGDIVGAAALAPSIAAVSHLLGCGLEARNASLQEALLSIDTIPAYAAAGVRAEILAAIAAAYMLDRRLDEAIDVGTRIRQMPDDQVAFQIRINTEATLGSALVFAGRMDVGWSLLLSSIDRAQRAHLENEAARGFRMIGSCASVVVEYQRAIVWLTDGIAYAEHTERWNDRHYMSAHLAHVMWARGEWAQAEQLARQSLLDGRGGLTTRITALYVVGYLELGRGDYDDADAHLAEARTLGENMAELQRFSPAIWGLAESALRAGHPVRAVTLCEEGFAASTAVDDAAYLFPFVVTGTRALLGLGDQSGAREWVARSEEALGRRKIPGTMPALDHARGLIHLAEGRTKAARDELGRARIGWEERERFWEGCQVVLDLARCALRSRRPDDASSLAATALTRANDAGATVLAREAEALRGGRPARVAESALPLTGREAEVALLVAEGLTNRQIATRLTISPKTVSAHIEHILTKLDSRNRAEIAAWVVRHLPGAR